MLDLKSAWKKLREESGTAGEDNEDSHSTFFEGVSFARKEILIIVIFVTILVIGCFLGGIYISNNSNNVANYENEKLGFSFSYPSDWGIYSFLDKENRYRGELFFVRKDDENVNFYNLLKSSLVTVQVLEKNLSLENIKNEVEKRADKDENVGFIDDGEPEIVRDGKGVSYSLRKKTQNGVFMWRELYLIDNNNLYWVASNRKISGENFLKNRDNLGIIFDSFGLIEG